MHFLVTGASGFVGGQLVRYLLEKGNRVTALVRRSSNRAPLEKLGVRFAFGDLNTGEGLPEAVEGVDCVHHVGGVTKGRTADDYFRCNAEGTRLLAQAMSRLSKPPRMVYCSSLSAVGPTTVGNPRRETDQAIPVSIYGRSKLAGEQAVRQFAERVPSVIVRPPIVYGPGDRDNIPGLLPMAKLGVYVKSGFREKHFSFIHVNDLCEGLLVAAQRGRTIDCKDPASGVYHVSDGGQYSWQDFCVALSEAMGRRRPFVIPLPEVLGYAVGLTNELKGRITGHVPVVNRDKLYREATCEAWTCTSDRAREELGYSPSLPLPVGLKETMAWYRDQGFFR